jgi:hypothetical protein
VVLFTIIACLSIIVGVLGTRGPNQTSEFVLRAHVQMSDPRRYKSTNYLAPRSST